MFLGLFGKVGKCISVIFLFLHDVYYYSGEVVDYPLLVLLDATVFEIIFTGLENIICIAFAFDEVSEKKA